MAFAVAAESSGLSVSQSDFIAQDDATRNRDNGSVVNGHLRSRHAFLKRHIDGANCPVAIFHEADDGPIGHWVAAAITHWLGFQENPLAGLAAADA